VVGEVYETRASEGVVYAKKASAAEGVCEMTVLVAEAAYETMVLAEGEACEMTALGVEAVCEMMVLVVGEVCERKASVQGVAASQTSMARAVDGCNRQAAYSPVVTKV
jgi:hypothetical protein